MVAPLAVSDLTDGPMGTFAVALTVRSVLLVFRQDARMTDCTHPNTAAASAINTASVWCPDCERWVQLESDETESTDAEFWSLVSVFCRLKDAKDDMWMAALMGDTTALDRQEL